MIAPLARRSVHAALPLVMAFALAVPGWSATAEIDAGALRQVIRGFGGATVFRPTVPLTEAELDALYGNGPGQIGFSLLRIRVAEDATWRALELKNALGVRARGGEVMATPWSPPAEMKTNNSLIGGRLKPENYARYATYLNEFAGYMAAGGAPLLAISVQNEPDYQVTYESCDWSPAEMLDFCRNHARAVTATRLIAPESFQYRRAISDPLLNDSAALANVDIIGTHIYGAAITPYPLADAKRKERWMTEHLVLDYDWSASLATAKELHDCLATAEFSAYIWWYAVRYYGPLGEDGIVTKRGHVMSQFAKFIRPGFHRVTATASPAARVYVSAYVRDQLVIVAINQNPTPVTQRFQITQGTVERVKPWLTTETRNVEPQPELMVTAGAFDALLPAQSVTTFVGPLALAAPVVVAAPRSLTVTTGTTATLAVQAAGPFLTYQWAREGVPLSGENEPLLTLRGVEVSQAGNYTVTVANSGGSVTTPPAALAVIPGAGARPVNLSTRSFVGAGDRAQIAGFVIAGTGRKQVLIRAAGPALAALGLSAALADPTIELRGSDGAVLAANDNWAASLAPTFAALHAFPWAPGSKDAALLVELAPGGYTAVVRGQGDTTGVALVEVYDADGGTAAVLTNLSTRSAVTAGEPQIGGFGIAGETARTVVIRASGPALHTAAGLLGTLEDPVMELRRQSDHALLATADDWTQAEGAHFQTVGAFAWKPGSRDTALVVTLDPGLYTAVVRGREAGEGVALVEIYAAP